MKKENKIKCMECGEMVFPNEKHTYTDCQVYKDKLKKPKSPSGHN